jgi:hypothetical protein
MRIGADVNISLPFSKIKMIDFSLDKLVFLSDLEPETVRWTPFLPAGKIARLLEMLYTPRPDRNLDGLPLQLRTGQVTKQYAKGLAIHSRTELVYRLAGKYRRFAAVAGMDPKVAGNGHLRLEIKGDDKLLLDATISNESDPLPIDLDITDVRRLRILVDFGEHWDIGDHLNLCDARMTK